MLKKLSAILALAIVGTPVMAQATVEDTDGDGVYSMDELAAAYPDITEEVFAEVDANQDGAVDEEELAAAQAAGLLAV